VRLKGCEAERESKGDGIECHNPCSLTVSQPYSLPLLKRGVL
jgi:hypothetical protein